MPYAADPTPPGEPTPRRQPMTPAEQARRDFILMADMYPKRGFSVGKFDFSPEEIRLIAEQLEKAEAIRAERDRLHALVNAPELKDFAAGVVLEAAHQRERWSDQHDAGKAPADWFWLVGFLAGKALAAHSAGKVDKALHHTISTSAVLANWHAAITGAHSEMRPGHAPEWIAEQLGRMEGA